MEKNLISRIVPNLMDEITRLHKKKELDQIRSEKSAKNHLKIIQKCHCVHWVVIKSGSGWDSWKLNYIRLFHCFFFIFSIINFEHQIFSLSYILCKQARIGYNYIFHMKAKIIRKMPILFHSTKKINKLRLTKLKHHFNPPWFPFRNVSNWFLLFNFVMFCFIWKTKINNRC